LRFRLHYTDVKLCDHLLCVAIPPTVLRHKNTASKFRYSSEDFSSPNPPSSFFLEPGSSMLRKVSTNYKELQGTTCKGQVFGSWSLVGTYGLSSTIRTLVDIIPHFLRPDRLSIYFTVTLGLFTYVPDFSGFGFHSEFWCFVESTPVFGHSLPLFAGPLSSSLKTSKQRTSSPALPVTLQHSAMVHGYEGIL
jgi:hypothetical protein